MHRVAINTEYKYFTCTWARTHSTISRQSTEGTRQVSWSKAQRSHHLEKVFRVFIVQIFRISSQQCPFPAKSHLLYLTLATMQGFGSVGGCLGRGLRGRRAAEYVCQSHIGEGNCLCEEWAHLSGCGTGRAGRGAPGIGSWAAEGLRPRREVLGSAGRGFWGGLGFSSSYGRADNDWPGLSTRGQSQSDDSNLRPGRIMWF